MTKNEFGGELFSKFHPTIKITNINETFERLIAKGLIKDYRTSYCPETKIATVYFTPIYELKKIQISFTIDINEDPDKPSKGLYLL